MKVKNLIKGRPLSLSGEATLKDALDIILQNGSTTVFVVDAAERVLGSLSIFDIFRSSLPSYFEDVGSLSYLPPSSIISSIKEKLAYPSGTAVRDILSKDFIAVEEDTPAVEAIRLMVTKKETAAAVLKDERLVATISASDIARGLLKE